MEIIAFNQIPDLFAVVGKLFVEKKEELCDMDAVSYTHLDVYKRQHYAQDNFKRDCR